MAKKPQAGPKEKSPRRPNGKAKAMKLHDSRAEVEFLQAMDAYVHENRRAFPTWSEVLQVLQKLGYRKKPLPRPDQATARLEQMCAQLKEERDHLSLELAKTQKERDEYLKAVYKLTWEDADFDKDEVMANLGNGPSIMDVLKELQAQGA